ncbi:hypothetical protein V490_00379 [Pseudogymnoascus sp. VKM F-3557]|nr:hypothetical protein V490_00379 [Pseudogymnoascus sp. VKM F-3557]
MKLAVYGIDGERAEHATCGVLDTRSSSSSPDYFVGPRGNVSPGLGNVSEAGIMLGPSCPTTTTTPLLAPTRPYYALYYAYHSKGPGMRSTVLPE